MNMNTKINPCNAFLSETACIHKSSDHKCTNYLSTGEFVIINHSYTFHYRSSSNSLRSISKKPSRQYPKLEKSLILKSGSYPSLPIGGNTKSTIPSCSVYLKEKIIQNVGNVIHDTLLERTLKGPVLVW